MIKQLEHSDLAYAINVIQASFMTVARDFDLTKQNAPTHTAFMKLEHLQQNFEKGYLMFGLYDNEHMAGFVALSRKDDGSFELHNLAVLPEYRHKGYGKQLLDFCKNKVAELHGTKIILSIIEENTTLKNWYTTNGFVHTGTKTFPHLPFTAGYMEWTGTQTTQ